MALAKYRCIRTLSALWLLFAWAALPVLACPPESMTRGQLLELEAGSFKVTDDGARQALAMDLLQCLSSPDPELRDGVAYEGLFTWMRSGALSAATAAGIFERLLPVIAPGYADADGVERPFAALVLAEVARRDRLEPFLEQGRRLALASAAADYLETVGDYRGFDEQEGWRHGVAHGADLVLQLSLNPKLGRRELDRLLAAVARQIAPGDAHFYRYGEPERLARAVFYLSSRNLHADDDWNRWFERVSAPDPLSAWGDAFRSQAGLAKRHNTLAFLRALYVFLREDGGEEQRRLLMPLLEAIRRIG
jgi:hypothetical protein